MKSLSKKMKTNLVSSFLLLLSVLSTIAAKATDPTTQPSASASPVVAISKNGASEIPADIDFSIRVSEFLCRAGLCPNKATISDLKTRGFNVANLSEWIAGSNKNIYRISFQVEDFSKAFRRKYSGCNLIVTDLNSLTEQMSLESCEFESTPNSDVVSPLSLGENEILHPDGSGWLANTMQAPIK